MGEAALLIVTMEEGAENQAHSSARSRKGWKWFSLEPLEGPALPTAAYSPVRPMLDSPSGTGNKTCVAL